MAQIRSSWSAPISKSALRSIMAGATGGLLSIVLFAAVAVIIFTG